MRVTQVTYVVVKAAAFIGMNMKRKYLGNRFPLNSEYVITFIVPTSSIYTACLSTLC